MKSKKLKLILFLVLTILLINQISAFSINSINTNNIPKNNIKKIVSNLMSRLTSFSNTYEQTTEIEECTTKISMSPTISTQIANEIDLNSALKNNKLASAILLIDHNLDVLDYNNKIIGSLDEIYYKTVNRFIPIVKVQNKNIIPQFITFLKTKDIEDIFVISSDYEIIKEIKQLYPNVNGIVEFNNITYGDLTNEKLMKIVGDTNKSYSKVALLPESLLTRNNVEFLQKKLITVWGIIDDNAICIHKAITCGVNGIVTQNPIETINIIESYNGNSTITRHQFIIGHRGAASLAPENTMSSYKKAYELGADIIETDIYLTKDNKIAIIHDSTLDRTTNGKGNVEDYTLPKLKELYANNKFSAEYPNERIPTLDEVFDEFKCKDIDIFVEIKSLKPEIIPLLINLLKEKDMVDQVSLLISNTKQAILLRELLPEISVGYLSSSCNAKNPYDFLIDTLRLIQPIGSTFNTSYSLLTKEYLNIAKQRGLTMWPWTYRNEIDFSNHFLMGINGLTTDYPQWISNKEVKIEPEFKEYQLNLNDIKKINTIATTYQGNKNIVCGKILVLQGSENLQVSENTITAINEGEAYIQLKYTSDIFGKPYDLYTQPIKIKVNNCYHNKINLHS